MLKVFGMRGRNKHSWRGVSFGDTRTVPMGTGVIATSGLAVLALGLLCGVGVVDSQPTHAATNDDTTISITPASGINLNMTPTAGTQGSFGTATANVTVTTTGAAGYTFTMNTETTDTDLKNSRVDYTTHPDQKITNITTTTTQSNFSPNKWGYNVSKNGTYIKGATNTYVPIPNPSSSEADRQIEITDVAGSNTYTFTYGVKANNNIQAGDYKNILVFSAIANEVPTPIMQEFDYAACQALTTDETITMIDSRDDTEYTVAKLKDGNCWMTQNLELGQYGTPMNLTDELSNVSSSGYTLNLPYANNSVYKGNSNHYGNYYYYDTATAGSGTSITTEGEDAPYSICPKGWRLPSAGPSGSTVTTKNEFYLMLNNYITTGTWDDSDPDWPYWGGVTTSQFTNAPVSLVFSGRMLSDDGTLYDQGYDGYWWSSTTYDSSSAAFFLDANTNGYVNPRGLDGRDIGHSVRCLVNNQVRNGMYMQDITPALLENTPTDVTYTVKDKRDETEYTVSKLKDGNLWMTQNLELGQYGTPMNLTDELSNVSSSGYTLNLPYANNSVYKGNSNHYGNYYNWMTATAGSGTSTAGQDAPYSICPKGWRLPQTTTVATNSEFYTLLNQNYITTGTWKEATSTSAHWEGVTTSQFLNQPVSLVFSGRMGSDGTLLNQGYYGRWWSSTSNGSSLAFYLNANTYGSVGPRNNDDRGYGFSVRCLVPGS